VIKRVDSLDCTDLFFPRGR